MLGRAEKVTAGAVVAEGLVTAGTVVARGRVAARAVETAELAGAKGCVAVWAVGTTKAAGARGCVAARAVDTAEVARARVCVAARAVETVEVAGARGCWTVGATKVARLAEAGCWAPGAIEVARLAEAGDCWAAGATEVARLAEAGGCWAAGTGGGCRECAHSWDMYVVWLRSATAMAAAVERVWASREVRRASCSLSARAVSRIPARVVPEVRFRAVAFVGSGRSSRSCSAVTKSSACWSAVVRACSIPSSTSRRETIIILARISGSRLSQTGAR